MNAVANKKTTVYSKGRTGRDTKVWKYSCVAFDSGCEAANVR